MADCFSSQNSFVGSNWILQNQSWAQSASLRDFSQAFPRRRPTGRVTKPCSAGNSPSSAGRRRTATMPHSPPMYQPISSREYLSSLNVAALATAIQGARRSRPISWHPVSMEPTEFLTTQYYQQPMASDNMTTMPLYPQSVQPAPTTGDGDISQPFPSTEIPISHGFPFNGLLDQLPMQESSFLQVNGTQVTTTTWDDSASGLPTLSQPVSDNWPFDMMAMNQSIPSVGVAGSSYESVPSPERLTEPVTPDFLPIQQFGDNGDSQLHFGKQCAEDELVGMGLYNHPESFMESSLNGFTGKGLKLEETFTPSDNEEDDTAESNDQPKRTQNDSDKYSHTQSQTISGFEPSKQAAKPAGGMPQRSFFFADDLQQHIISEPQNSFNMGTTTCMNYGYEWI